MRRKRFLSKSQLSHNDSTQEQPLLNLAYPTLFSREAQILTSLSLVHISRYITLRKCVH